MNVQCVAIDLVLYEAILDEANTDTTFTISWTIVKEITMNLARDDTHSLTYQGQVDVKRFDFKSNKPTSCLLTSFIFVFTDIKVSPLIPIKTFRAERPLVYTSSSFVCLQNSHHQTDIILNPVHEIHSYIHTDSQIYIYKYK